MSVQNVRSLLLRIIGYIVPLAQQIPPLGIYTGLMTLPVLSNIILLFTDRNIQGLKNQIWPHFQQEWAQCLCCWHITCHIFYHLSRTTKKKGISINWSISLYQTSTIYRVPAFNHRIIWLQLLDSYQHIWNGMAFSQLVR